ncbi:hypothetical protein [Pseudodonghicola flavimaris]|uniref:Uncharacterized protein n=1 Tax=Pseudodonghicola flavimaris TaxID=3050036 RepID=A0ABT7EZ36_9RHOB|nr:hypothetical protein [Pseudodonghicola flavimaris]MDK3017612.1 hypothetical protein [Pseudodonghicola flavimaris]
MQTDRHQAERAGTAERDALSGPARVRALLFAPLEAAGMQRPGGMTVAGYEEMRARLCRALTHMSDRSLRGLAELVTRHAQGRQVDRWPKEVTLKSWGLRIQPPPARQSDYVASLMTSAMGRAARDQGYHVELFMLARRLGPPPSRYDLGRLRQEAEENRRMREIVRRQIDYDSASLDQRQWLAWYDRNETECLALMAAGDDRETGE